MSLCPYTYVRKFLTRTKPNPNGEANNLFVKVIKNGTEVVSVALPVKSAHWLIELIPADVVEQIKKEQIPLEQIQENLRTQPVLVPQSIFSLVEERRSVLVWLE